MLFLGQVESSYVINPLEIVASEMKSFELIELKSWNDSWRELFDWVAKVFGSFNLRSEN